MKHLVVVGGGISGLAAATVASRRAAEVPGGLRITVLEREPRVGGKALTREENGWLVETGPTGFLDNEPAVDRLVEAAGLEKLPANPAAARRFVVRGGRMREIRPNPFRFAASGILGPLGLLRLLGEPLVPGRRDGGDESVWDFAARRIGSQAADRLVAPMVLGVFAGDARRISLPAAFPRLHELERDHGSLVRGMIARRRAGRAGGGPAGPRGRLTSFRDGMEALPRALAARGAFEVRCSRGVEALEAIPQGGWRVVSGGEVLAADAVILAGEPWAMSAILPARAATIARELEAIACPPVAVVALGFGEESLECAPRGFGGLIPRGEGYRILGCLWDTHLFPGRSPERRLLVRAMLGGGVDPEVGGLDEETLVAVTRDDLARLQGLRAEPVFRRVTLWPRAIPQYEVGHVDRVARVRRELARLPGLHIAGNGLDGIAFTKAAAAGAASADEALATLACPRAAASGAATPATAGDQR